MASAARFAIIGVVAIGLMAAGPVKKRPAAPAPKFPETGTLGKEHLVASMHLAVLTNLTGNDPFEPDATSYLAGREVRISIPLKPPTAGGGGDVEYDVAKHSFDIRPFRFLNYVQLFHAERSEGFYTGQNSFGTKARIEKVSSDTLNIEFERKAGSPGAIYETTLSIEPEAGRALAAALRMEIEGSLVASSTKGGVTVCRVSYSEPPTIADPYEITANTCTIKIRVTRVAFVDTRRPGEVITEWREP